MPTLVPPDAAVAIRILVALVFLGAAIGKLRHWTIFVGVVANYRLLPRPLVAPAAYALPPTEAAIGAAMATGLWAPWSTVAAAILLSVFAWAMSVNLLRGRRHIDCGCFQGTLKQPLRWILVLRNVLLVLLLGASVATPPGSLVGWAAANGFLAGCALFVVLQALNVLWAAPPARPPRAQAEGTS